MVKGVVVGLDVESGRSYQQGWLITDDRCARLLVSFVGSPSRDSAFCVGTRWRRVAVEGEVGGRIAGRGTKRRRDRQEGGGDTAKSVQRQADRSRDKERRLLRGGRQNAGASSDTEHGRERNARMKD